MKEWRNGQQGIRADRADPGKIQERVRFMLPVKLVDASLRISVAVHARGGRRTGCDGNRSGHAGNFRYQARRYWDLVVIPAGRPHHAKLILWIEVVNQRTKSADAVFRIVQNHGRRRLQPEVAAVPAEAAVVGKLFGVAAATDLIVGLIEIAKAGDQVTFLVALKTGSRDHVEHAVGSIAIVRVIAAALHFHVIDVLGIELRANVAGDIRVGNRHAVHQPAHLVSAADVQLIVRYVRARNIFGDHRQAVGAVRSGRVLNRLAAQERGGSGGFHRGADRFTGDYGLFSHAGEL